MEMNNLRLLSLIVAFLGGQLTFAKSEPVYKIYGKTITLEEVIKGNKAGFYEVEKKRFELIDQAAREAFLNEYFERLAKSNKTTLEKAREEYFKKNVKISEKEVNDTLTQFKDHPRLKELKKKDQVKQIRDYLVERDKGKVVENILSVGLAKGDLKIITKEPVEPKYNLVVNGDDWVRYGPNLNDIKPLGCSKNCPITVVEYSEFECPFCSKVIPDIKRLLGEYKGKIRWIVRDFPLSFHQRARPAAIAAICAGEQGKYWHMYSKLFENQEKLGDKDFESYAKSIGVFNAKYKKCMANTAPAMARIDRNVASGARHGVSGTPAFFINGRRMAGALPYSQFKQVIDAELSSK